MARGSRHYDSNTIFAKIHKKVHYIDLSNSLRPVHVDQEFHIYNLKRFLQGLPHHVTKISLSKLDLGYYNEKNKKYFDSHGSFFSLLLKRETK